MANAFQKWTKWVNVILSIAVTAGVFSYLFSHITWAEVKDLIVKADEVGLLCFFVLSMTMNVLRTVRYRLVLQVSGHAPRSVLLFLVVIVRGLFVDLLPARLGELIYVYLLKTRLGVPLGMATTSFALAFLFDIIALAPLILIAALCIGVSSEMPVAILVAGGVFLLAVATALLYALPSCLRIAYWMLSRNFLARYRPVKAVRTFLASTDYQVKRSKRAGIYLPMLGLSFLVRLTKYGSLYVLFYALTRSLGYGLADLPIPKMFIGLCSAEMAASLPVSGIAGFGVYEGTWSVVFGLLGFPEKVAMLTSVSHHLFTQLYGYILGVMALLVLLLPVFKTKGTTLVPTD